MKTKVDSVSSRRATVIEFIEAGLVSSQNDLVKLLKKSGFDVTQATASRDLEELGAIKGKGPDGHSVYVFSNSLPQDSARSATEKVSDVADDLILEISTSGNLVVIRTPPGGAQLLASSIDRKSRIGELASVLGTIAGDDTVFLVSSEETSGEKCAQEVAALYRLQLPRSRVAKKSQGNKSLTPRRRG